MTNSSVATRSNQTMHNCARTYCQGYWSGYRSGSITQIDVASNGPCFHGMQKLIIGTVTAPPGSTVSNLRTTPITNETAFDQHMKEGEHT